jgi:hypothetical protein
MLFGDTIGDMIGYFITGLFGVLGGGIINVIPPVEIGTGLGVGVDSMGIPE